MRPENTGTWVIARLAGAKTAKHAGRRTEQRLRAAPVLTQRHGDRAGGSLALPSMPTNATRPRSSPTIPDRIRHAGHCLSARRSGQTALQRQKRPSSGTSLVLPAADHLPPRFTRPSNSPPSDAPTDRTSREWGHRKLVRSGEATEREHVEYAGGGAGQARADIICHGSASAPLPGFAGTHRPPRRGLARPRGVGFPHRGAAGRRAPHALTRRTRCAAERTEPMGAGHNGTPSRSNDTGTGCRKPQRAMLNATCPARPAGARRPSQRLPQRERARPVLPPLCLATEELLRGVPQRHTEVGCHSSPRRLASRMQTSSVAALKPAMTTTDIRASA